MASPLQVGIIGAGANTRAQHIPNLRAIDGVEVVAVCNRTRDSGDAVADAFGIPQVYASWMDLVEDEAIDAVVIGTWPSTHCAMTCAALEAGKHVLTEARMAMDAAEAHRMWETSKRCPGLVAQVVPSPFTLAFDRTIQRLIADDYLGPLLAVDVHASTGAFVEPHAPMHWRLDRGLSGLNTMTLGIWYEAIARWVGHAKQVTAMAKTCFPLRLRENGTPRVVEIPDHLDVVAELHCGAQAHIRCSAVTAHCPAPWSVFLYGAHGTLQFDGASESLRGIRRGESDFREVAIADPDRVGWRVEQEFVGAIRGEEPIRLTSFEEGVRYMEFTEAVAISAGEGRFVSLPLLS